jgi:hypothetical protein
LSKGKLIVAILFCLILVLSGCGKNREQTDVPAASGNAEMEQPSGTGTAGVRSIEKGVLSPLTGLPMEADLLSQRPMAVMIDNMAGARPQSGLQNADIVCEMPVEGGITRYMAIFHRLPAEKIGPVRSARSYFIDKAMEFNGVYVHCGGSPEALKDIQTWKVDSLNELKGEGNFWRTNDRKAPHNLYTSTKLVREAMNKKKFSDKSGSYHFNFGDAFVDLKGIAAKNILIDYRSHYKVGYRYDETKKLYFRIINGSKLKDKETDTEITTVNIIVERVSAKVVDNIGRLELTGTGSGNGYLITGGKQVEIKWSKKDRQSKTLYTDLAGNPIELNKGNTWIQVIPDNATIDFKE